MTTEPQGQPPKRQVVTGFDTVPPAKVAVPHRLMLKVVAVAAVLFVVVAIGILVLGRLRPDPHATGGPVVPTAVDRPAGGAPSQGAARGEQALSAEVIAAREQVNNPMSSGDPAELRKALMELDRAGHLERRDRQMLLSLLQDSGDLAAARAQVELLLAAAPRDPRTRILACRQGFLEGDLGQLEPLLALVAETPELQRVPAYPDLLELVGGLAARAGRLQELVPLVSDERALDDERLLAFKVRALLAARRADDARALVLQDTRLDGIERMTMRAQVELADGKVEPARAMIREAIALEVSRRNATGLLEIAGATARLGAPLMAAESWEAWLALQEPGEAPARLLNACAEAFLRVGQTEKAAACFRDLASRPQAGMRARNNQLYLDLLLRKDVARDAAAAEELLAQAPDNPALRGTVLYARLASNRAGQARALADEPLKLPRSPAVILAVAMAHAATGDQGKAREIAGAIDRRALLPEERAHLDAILAGR